MDRARQGRCKCIPFTGPLPLLVRGRHLVDVERLEKELPKSTAFIDRYRERQREAGKSARAARLRGEI